MENSIITMDIETVNINQNQIPIAITLCDSDKNKLFFNNKNIGNDNNKLWLDLFKYLEGNSIQGQIFIFVHNLGSFDGYFIFKTISKLFHPSQVQTMIDHHNKFIKIILKKNKEFIWIDSYRIFPISLDNLCKQFSVDGKLDKYKLEYNNLDNLKGNLFNEFKNYALQDSKALYDCLTIAQQIYINEYNVDITSIVSTPSLSMRIFMLKFLKFDIPILKRVQDKFIRKGYYGGHTDYYKKYIKKGFYYDVNSLYLFAMLKPMPHEIIIINHHKNMDNINLNDFFGNIKCEIETPNDILKPLLPYKDPNTSKTIYPVGKWSAIYFSEELKAVLLRIGEKYGYKFKLLEGYEFSRINLFSDYVNHFYNIKKSSGKNSPQRFIAKLHLNTLYGTFGRKQEVIQTINVFNHELYNYISVKFIKSMITINDEITTLFFKIGRAHV